MDKVAVSSENERNDKRESLPGECLGKHVQQRAESECEEVKLSSNALDLKTVDLVRTRKPFSKSSVVKRKSPKSFAPRFGEDNLFWLPIPPAIVLYVGTIYICYRLGVVDDALSFFLLISIPPLILVLPISLLRRGKGSAIRRCYWKEMSTYREEIKNSVDVQSAD